MAPRAESRVLLAQAGVTFTLKNKAILRKLAKQNWAKSEIRVTNWHKLLQRLGEGYLKYAAHVPISQ